jgi:hypothetical protein
VIKGYLFFTKWCGQCGEVKRICDQRSDVLVVDAEVVADSKDHELKRILSLVNSVPTLILLDEDGQPMGRANTPHGIKTELNRIQ